MERKFSTYRNDNDTEVQVHRVTEETAGGVYITGEGHSNTVPGDLLVQDNANSFTRVRDLEGYTAIDGIDVESDDRDTPDENAVDQIEDEEHPDDFDPSAHKVGVVNAYIHAHPDYADAIRERERAGKNRTSIVEG